MRTVCLLLCTLLCIAATAQSNLTANIIEGGKTLVELVRVFKSPKSGVVAVPAANPPKTDSCTVKNISDICFKNTTAKSIYITLIKRNGSVYETLVLTIKILPRAQECMYELRAGIYKLKIETDGEEDMRVMIREGEMKLSACENPTREVKLD